MCCIQTALLAQDKQEHFQHDSCAKVYQHQMSEVSEEPNQATETPSKKELQPIETPFKTSKSVIMLDTPTETSKAISIQRCKAFDEQQEVEPAEQSSTEDIPGSTPHGITHESSKDISGSPKTQESTRSMLLSSNEALFIFYFMFNHKQHQTYSVIIHLLA